MKVLLSWLREFVEVRAGPDELAHLLSMSGSEVGSVQRVGSSWERVFIGRVSGIEPHPSAGRLLVVDADLGGRHLPLVTAATNLGVGDKVPVVLAGGQLGGGRKVSAADFRGIRSEGMLCSGIELGISEDADGIYVLEPEAPVGNELRAYLGDVVLDLELTPNRPDCLSVVGIAREVAALTGGTLRVPETALPAADFDSAERISIEIRDPDLCPRYSAVVLHGVRVAPSPQWMQRRLYLSGVRPHNNIVDVTNYVMLERGQPLHAFDGAKLRGGIVVRRAAPGETIVTLDGDLRRMSDSVLVIADHARAVAVAGVMGGLDSEVDLGTTLVVLESANFDRGSIRRTSRELKLATEASKRFDKGLDPELTVPSALMAAELMALTSGATAGRGVADAYPRPARPAVLSVAPRDVERLLGMPLQAGEMRRVFAALGFGVREAGEELEVTVPTFRRDVEGKADLTEEVARIVGYDSIPTTLPTGAVPEAAEASYRFWERVARDTLAAAGLQEVITYSLVDAGAASRVTADTSPEAARVETDLIPLRNPMTPEQASLRTTLLPSLLRTAAANLRHESRVWIFELGRVYLPPLDPLPGEVRRLGMLATGARHPQAWNTSRDDADLFDLKGVVESLLGAMGVREVSFRNARHVSMHPGRTAALLVGERVAGYLGQVHPTVVERYDLQPRRLYAAELDFELLMGSATRDRRYEPLPRFPAVSHDLAVVVDARWTHADLVAEIQRAGEPLLSLVELFDLYQGSQIEPGKKSLAFSLTYRAPDRTLTDDEVGAVESRIVSALSQRFGATIRGR